ncbi:hypothetical protein NC797_14200 [Aquibacillus sp. 3ASR75-11]|uniref:Uncharacterized protein n=1 Tax=Terrihalobacillus insolitus TaxID=2950438 RepID=A0A9X3WU73_9BACI|nr:hypothetical protein [Terrihalobacillus insolitus]MDC3425655.1 hypothetical protein [Terrihalobacillus insolitus]
MKNVLTLIFLLIILVFGIIGFANLANQPDREKQIDNEASSNGQPDYFIEMRELT